MARIKIKNVEQWREVLAKKVVPVKLTKVSRRVISHWYEVGLIDSEEKEDHKSRYLSYMEFYWVCIMVECRKLGYSIKNLKKVKEKLHSMIPSDFMDEEIPMLEEAVLHMIKNRQSLYLELTNEGEAVIINEKAFHYGSRASFYTSNIIIRLNRLFRDRIKNIHFRTEFINYPKLSENDRVVVASLNEDNTQSITITKKNNEVELIEIEEDIIVDKRIIDILNEEDYQTIEIKQHNGKISKIKRTVKHKPTKKADD